MNTLLFTSLVFADVVLLRYQHGAAADRHTDQIECAELPQDDRDDQLFNAGRLLAHIVLPDALWCDTDGRTCHDSTSSRSFNTTSLHCDEKADAPIRCVVRIDCVELINTFWLSLGITLLAIVAFVVIPEICAAGVGGVSRRPPYTRDTSL